MSAAHDPLRVRLRRDAGGYVEWVRLTDSALLGLALAFLGLLVLPYLVTLRGGVATAVNLADALIWLGFAVDYFVRLYLALDRTEYVKRNVLDLLIVLVPFLRPIRAVRLLRLLRLVSVGAIVQKRATSLHARVTSYVASTAVVVTVVAGFLMYDVEKNAPHANITNLSDAFWWAVTTMTTVGYGDRYPVTGTGRLIAIVLMGVGIALLGVITASIAAWFVRRMQEVQDTDEATQTTLEDVLTEVRRLHARLDALEPDLARAPAYEQPDEPIRVEG